MASGVGSSTYVVEHLSEVEAALTAAGTVKIPAALRRVTVEGAKVLRASIRAAAPVGKKARPTQGDVPGNLRASVRYKVSRGSRGLTYTVGAFGRGSAHRHLVIYGHDIKGHGRLHAGRQVSAGTMSRGRLRGAGVVSYRHTIGRKATSGARRTRPNPFVERGAAAGGGAAVTALEAAAAAAIRAVA